MMKLVCDILVGTVIVIGFQALIPLVGVMPNHNEGPLVSSYEEKNYDRKSELYDMITVDEMREKQEVATRDLSALMLGLQPGNVMGSNVCTNYIINQSKIENDSDDDKITFKIIIPKDDEENDVTIYDGSVDRDFKALKENVIESSAYAENITYHSNGNIKEMTYTLIR